MLSKRVQEVLAMLVIGDGVKLDAHPQQFHK